MKNIFSSVLLFSLALAAPAATAKSDLSAPVQLNAVEVEESAVPIEAPEAVQEDVAGDKEVRSPVEAVEEPVADEVAESVEPIANAAVESAVVANIAEEAASAAGEILIGGPDSKTSLLDPAFAPFDFLEKGPGATTTPCTADNECQTACCDGTNCRAPDALKGPETCRNGLAPDFSQGLVFVTLPVSEPGAGAAAQTELEAQAAAAGIIIGGPDSKTSLLDPAFEPFDKLEKGSTVTTGACTVDSDCQTACCDGAKCRAPDALKAGETCRNGLAPDFSNGLTFVVQPVSGGAAEPTPEVIEEPAAEPAPEVVEEPAAEPASGEVAVDNDGVDISVLPEGITVREQSPTSEFCAQFLDIEGIFEADGTQRKEGGLACSSTPIGLLPDVDRILQTLIVEPEYDAVLDASVDNTVVLNTKNLDSGFFNDPNSEYYMVPSTLLGGNNRIIQGHQHVTVQNLGTADAPLDPQIFAFFKGVNDVEIDASRQRLQTIIPAGTIKEDGNFRICTISGTDGHQSAVAPVQVRGSTDDCIRVSFINSVQEAPTNIADDIAENAEITENGVATGVEAKNDNAGVDAGGQDLEAAVEEKVEEKKEEEIAAGEAPVVNDPFEVNVNVNQQVVIQNGGQAATPAAPVVGQAELGQAGILDQLRVLVAQMAQLLN